jgi:hypothetical protein
MSTTLSADLLRFPAFGHTIILHFVSLDHHVNKDFDIDRDIND